MLPNDEGPPIGGRALVPLWTGLHPAMDKAPSSYGQGDADLYVRTFIRSNHRNLQAKRCIKDDVFLYLSNIYGYLCAEFLFLRFN